MIKICKLTKEINSKQEIGRVDLLIIMDLIEDILNSMLKAVIRILHYNQLAGS